MADPARPTAIRGNAANSAVSAPQGCPTVRFAAPAEVRSLTDIRPKPAEKTLISRSELARAARVSKAAITQACRRGPLANACDGPAIDVAHPATQAYLRAHVQDVPAALAAARRARPSLADRLARLQQQHSALGAQLDELRAEIERQEPRS